MKNHLILIFLIALVSCTNDNPTNAAIEQTFKKKSVQKNSSNKVQKKNTNKSEKIKYSDLIDFKVLSVTEGLYESAPALQVNLTLPVDNKQDVDALIKVYTGKNNKKVNGGWIYNDNKSSLYFPFIEAQTQYKVVINNGLLAINGKKINKGYDKKIQTRSYKKSARFISKGSTLLKDSNILPIEAVNVAAVDMKFWRINPEKYSDFLNMSYRNEIYTLERMHKMGKVVYTAQFELSSEKNKREKHNISIKDIEVVQKPGLYFVTMTPVDVYSYNIQNTWFVSTNIGIHTRKYPGSLVVFTHQLPQAQAYENVEIKIIDAQGATIVKTISDKDGFAQVRTNDMKKARFVLAQKGDNFNIVRLNQSKMDLSEFNLSSKRYHPQELFLYGPRDLYRPGESVYINGLLRDDDGQFISSSPIKVEIRRPDNRIYQFFNWQGDKTSLYSSQFHLPDDAPRGQWTFVATLANKDKFEYPFSVEDFLPERLKLDLSNHNQQVQLQSDQSPTINIQSDYLYGAPAANNRFDVSVSIRSQVHLFDQYKEYEFGSKKYNDYDLEYDIPRKKLDKNGFAKIVLENKWKKTQFPLRIKSYVNIYESGGRPVMRRISQTIWPHDVAIGVRPDWVLNDNRFASPNSNNLIDLIAVNTKGEKIDMNNVDVLLIRENNQRYWHWGDDGWRYNNSQENVAVFDTVLNLKKDQVNTVSLPLDYGNYRVEIRDEKQTLICSYSFFSGWRWYDATNNKGQRPDQVKLVWHSDSIKQSDDAKLTITAPYSGLAIITVESDQLLWKKTINMNTPQQEVTIPIDAGWSRHDIYVSAMVIASGDHKRKHLPNRAFGIIHLPLDRQNRQLDIVIKNPEKILPESQVTIKVIANNLSNKSSFVTLAAVDTGVLNVSNFKTPDPFDWFFSPRQYITEIRDMYQSIIAYGDGKNSSQKFGGDQDINRGGDSPQSEVQIVSLFNKKVKFNDEGLAQFELDIPYFNGEIRLMAMAYNDSQIASAESRMKVAAPIVVSSSMPRFIAKNDQSFAVIDVHNTEDVINKININVSADNYLGNQSINKSLELKPKEKHIIKLPITATTYQGLGSINVVAEIRGKNAYKLDRKWNLGIRPANAAVTDSQLAVIEAGQSLKIPQSQFNEFASDGLKSILKVSNTPVLNAENRLKNLIQYPYGCLEQTTSRALPLLNLQESDLAEFTQEKAREIYQKRQQLIQQAIGKIVGMQRYDGSFGMWSNASPTETWLSVYATDFLLQAKSFGYNVPESTLKKAIDRLRIYVRKGHYIRSDLGQFLSNKKHYHIAYRAYASSVLARIKQITLQDIRQSYDKESQFSKTGLPYAHYAQALELLGDERRAKKAWLQAFDFDNYDDKYHYYGDYGTNIRDLSEIILLGTQSQLVKGLAKSSLSLMPKLLDQLKGKKWLSTQESAALYRLSKQLKKNKNQEKWQLSINKNNHTDDFDQQNDLTKIWYANNAKEGLILTNNSKKPLFVDLKTQGYSKTTQQQKSSISIERNYYDTKGIKIDFHHLKTGEMVLVHLAVKLDKNQNYLPDALLIELMPAGLELENQNLEHSMRIDDLKIDNKYIYEWKNRTSIKHEEYQDDRFITALPLSRYQTSDVFYLARAVTPGVYNIPSTLIEDMYHPEIRVLGKNDGKIIITE